MKETGGEHLRLLPETKRLIEGVEAETGRRLVIRGDAAVRRQGRAIYVVSDPDPDHHLILFDPAEAAFLDHLVGHEIGHLVRFFRAAPADRLVPVTTGERRAKALRHLLPEFRKLIVAGIPEAAIADVYPIWLSGTISQLTSTPADTFIERWLWQNLPGLRKVQAESLRSQIHALQRVNQPVVEAHTPASVWRASNAMNYALVKSIAELLHDHRLLRPYANGVVRSLGDELLGMVEASPDQGLNSDRRLSDQWAARLGFNDWFEWRRLDELPRGFRHAWE